MPISYLNPQAAVNAVCTACGSTVYCGGAACPSVTLPSNVDATGPSVGQIAATYVSVKIWVGPSVGFGVQVA